MTPELRFTYRIQDPYQTHTVRTETKEFDTLKAFVKSMSLPTPILNPDARIESAIIYGKYTNENLKTVKDLTDYCNARLKYRPEKRITMHFRNELSEKTFMDKERGFTKIGPLTYETTYEILIKNIVTKAYPSYKINPHDVILDFVNKTATFATTKKIEKQETALSRYLTENGIKDKDIIDIHSEGKTIAVRYRTTVGIARMLDSKDEFEKTCRHYDFSIFNAFTYKTHATEHPVTKTPCMELTTEEKHTLREWIRMIQDIEKETCEIQLVEGTFHAIIELYREKTSELLTKVSIRTNENRIVNAVWRADGPDHIHAYYVLLGWNNTEDNEL